jgi:hypothetical protein
MSNICDICEVNTEHKHLTLHKSMKIVPSYWSPLRVDNVTAHYGDLHEPNHRIGPVCRIRKVYEIVWFLLFPVGGVTSNFQNSNFFPAYFVTLFIGALGYPRFFWKNFPEIVPIFIKPLDYRSACFAIAVSVVITRNAIDSVCYRFFLEYFPWMNI